MGSSCRSVRGKSKVCLSTVSGTIPCQRTSVKILCLAPHTGLSSKAQETAEKKGAANPEHTMSGSRRHRRKLKRPVWNAAAYDCAHAKPWNATPGPRPTEVLLPRHARQARLFRARELSARRCGMSSAEERPDALDGSLDAAVKSFGDDGGAPGPGAAEGHHFYIGGSAFGRALWALTWA